MVTIACSRACSDSALRDANVALAPAAGNFHFARQCGRSPLQSLPGILVSPTGHLRPSQRARLLCKSQSPHARTTPSSSFPLTFVHSRGCAQSVRPLGPAWSRSKPLAVLEPREDATRQVRRQAAGKLQGLSSLHDSCRGSIGNACFMLVNPSLRILWRAASCSANNQTPHVVKDRHLTALNHKSQWRLCRSWSST